jgi:ribonuclease HI
MMYSLPAVSLSEDTSYQVQKRALAKFLQCFGFEEKFPRAVVFGPMVYSGMEIKQLYNYCLCRKIESISCHINAKTEIGTITNVVVTWQQIQCGTSIPYLTDPDPITYITNNWFTHVKDYCNKIAAQIPIKNVWVPHLTREYDIILMDIVRYLPIPPIHKRGFNNWRIYFQANTLASLTNHSGTKLEAVYFKRKEVIDFRPRSTLNWPNQQRPSRSTFRIWVNTLRAIINFSDNGDLPQHLGAWTSPPTNEIKATTMIHRNSTMLAMWNYTIQRWKLYTHHETQYGTIHFHRQNFQTTRSLHMADFIPVDYCTSDTTFIIHSRTIAKVDYPIKSPASIIPHEDLEQFIKDQPVDWYSPLLEHINFVGISHHQFSEDDEIIICSDGGLQNQVGSYGVVMSINGSIKITLQGRVPLAHTKLASHRCECFGALAALILYKITSIFIAKKYDNVVKVKRITLYSDSKSMIDTLNEWKNKEPTIKFYYNADADIIKQMLEEYQIISKRKETIKFLHVRGHQDCARQQLTYAESLNVEADLLATAALRIRTALTVDFPTLLAAITINKQRITAHHSAVLSELFTSIKLRTHLKTVNSWNDATFDTVWWKPQGDVLGKCFPGEQKTLIKFIHNRWAVNRKQNRYYGYISPYCKLCPDIIECQSHVLCCSVCPERQNSRSQYVRDLRRLFESLCPDIIECQNHVLCCSVCPERQNSRSQYVRDLRRLFESLHTNGTTINVIIHYVSECLANRPAPDIRIVAPEASYLLQRAVTEQTSIGWSNWLKGRITITWGILYNHDIATTNHGLRNPNSEDWAKRIVELTWNFVLRTWTIRNELEHQTEGDAEQNQKDRLIDKIMWTKRKLDNFPNNYLKNLIVAQIKDLPLANLTLNPNMMDAQIQALRMAGGRATANRGT